MPCYEPRREFEDVTAAEEKVRWLEGMLCALCNEVTDKTMKDAEVNGQSPSIANWFNKHQLEDIKRIKDKGLPSSPSYHETRLWNAIKKGM